MDVIGSPKHRSCLTIEVAERDCLTLSRSTWKNNGSSVGLQSISDGLDTGWREAFREVGDLPDAKWSWQSWYHARFGEAILFKHSSAPSIHFTVQVDEGGLAHGKKIPQPPSLHSLLFAFKSEPLVYTVEICGLHPHWTWVMHFRALSC